jgi:hypothetical protein
MLIFSPFLLYLFLSQNDNTSIKNERNLMKKIFCLCLVITLGAHSMQAGIRGNTYKYAAATAKGIVAGTCLLISAGCLAVSIVFLTRLQVIKDEEQDLLKGFRENKRPLYESKIKIIEKGMGLCFGTLGAAFGYATYKLGRSTLKDMGLVSRKART